MQVAAQPIPFVAGGGHDPAAFGSQGLGQLGGRHDDGKLGGERAEQPQLDLGVLLAGRPGDLQLAEIGAPEAQRQRITFSGSRREP